MSVVLLKFWFESMKKQPLKCLLTNPKWLTLRGKPPSMVIEESRGNVCKIYTWQSQAIFCSDFGGFYLSHASRSRFTLYKQKLLGSPFFHLNRGKKTWAKMVSSTSRVNNQSNFFIHLNLNSTRIILEPPPSTQPLLAGFGGKTPHKNPPSATTMLPVIKLAASLLKNSTSELISRGEAARPIAVRSFRSCL